MKKRFDFKKRKDELMLLCITIFVECLLCFWSWNCCFDIDDQIWMGIGGIVIIMPYLFRIDKRI
jgi:hypothetical protein